MIFCVLLCTFLRITSTQPLLDNEEDDDQTQLDDSLLNTYIAIPGRFSNYNHHQFNIPQNFYDDHQQQESYYRNKQYNPANVNVFKRIIMLPRVGRRSVRSTSNK